MTMPAGVAGGHRALAAGPGRSGPGGVLPGGYGSRHRSGTVSEKLVHAG